MILLRIKTTLNLTVNRAQCFIELSDYSPLPSYFDPLTPESIQSTIYRSKKDAM